MHFTVSSLPLVVAQALAAAFLSVLFLQSGLDKVFDWKGNKEYISGYFAKSPVAGWATLLLLKITVLEVLSGAASAAGCVVLVATGSTQVAFIGAVLSAVSVLALFLGQRIAKDYAGAAGMVPYAMFCIGSVLVQGQSASQWD